MTVVAAWLTNRGDAAGGQTRAATRLTPIGTWWPTGELTSRSGLIPGGAPCLVTGTSMTATIAVGRAIIQGSAAAGAYAVAVTVAETLVIPNGDPTNARRDIIGLRVYNNLVDASGQTIAKVERLPGTPAPSPVDPTPPVGAVWLPLARVVVPANASSGSPINWGTALTDLRAFTAGHGGILPVDASNAAGSYAGQYRDTGTGLERWTGSAWTAYPPAAARPGIGRLVKPASLSIPVGTLYRIVTWDRAVARNGVTAINSSGASAASGVTGLRADAAGYYRATATIELNSAATGVRSGQIYRTTDPAALTGITWLGGFSVPGAGAGQAAGSIATGPVLLAANEVICLAIYQDSATNPLGVLNAGMSLQWVDAP
ncbi:hypothetical protein ACIBSV_12075 [Embleya sp. NPDC050154]|uniref:hypothetical protein n=1 Tax=Embleya sp. NPDC050154 TaxID=3363988 RepID=UPI0037B5D24D